MEHPLNFFRNRQPSRVFWRAAALARGAPLEYFSESTTPRILPGGRVACGASSEFLSASADNPSWIWAHGGAGARRDLKRRASRCFGQAAAPSRGFGRAAALAHGASSDFLSESTTLLWVLLRSFAPFRFMAFEAGSKGILLAVALSP